MTSVLEKEKAFALALLSRLSHIKHKNQCSNSNLLLYNFCSKIFLVTAFSRKLREYQPRY